MATFLMRVCVIDGLFFLGSIFDGLFSQAHIALPLWFTAVTIWTLQYGYRKSLWMVIPFLIFTDVIWDGRIGAIFFFGFLLSTFATFSSVRIKTQSLFFQTIVYSVLIALFSTFVPLISIFLFQDSVSFQQISFLFSIFLLHVFVSLLFFPPFSKLMNRLETLFDTSYQDQMKKIR